MAKEYIIGQEYLDSQNQKKTAYFKDAEAVSTTEVQELTDAQKNTARNNIGASSLTDFQIAMSQLIDLRTKDNFITKNLGYTGTVMAHGEARALQAVTSGDASIVWVVFTYGDENSPSTAMIHQKHGETTTVQTIYYGNRVANRTITFTDSTRTSIESTTAWNTVTSLFGVQATQNNIVLRLMNSHLDGSQGLYLLTLPALTSIASGVITPSQFASLVNGGDYDSNSKTIRLKHGDTVLASIDATAFIKDGMVSNVTIRNGQLVIVFNTDAGKEDIRIPLTDIFNPNNYYTKSETDSHLTQKQTEIDDLYARIGYYVCSTNGNVAAKTIVANNYTLGNGGSMKIKMTNANTADNATLNINSTGAKPLYYDGERASSNNSWEAGETVEVYYDGTNFYANNVAGGSGSDDGVFDVSAKYPTSGVDGGNTYTLDGALAVLNANLSANKKKGGMSIKFIQSSDNKYVQSRYMGTSIATADFTNVSNWQIVDTSNVERILVNTSTEYGILSLKADFDFDSMSLTYYINRTHQSIAQMISFGVTTDGTTETFTYQVSGDVKIGIEYLTITNGNKHLYVTINWQPITTGTVSVDVNKNAVIRVYNTEKYPQNLSSKLVESGGVVYNTDNVRYDISGHMEHSVSKVSGTDIIIFYFSFKSGVTYKFTASCTTATNNPFQFYLHKSDGTQVALIGYIDSNDNSKTFSYTPNEDIDYGYIRLVSSRTDVVTLQMIRDAEWVSDIVDSLDSDNPKKALSAKQGGILNGKIEKSVQTLSFNIGNKISNTISKVIDIDKIVFDNVTLKAGMTYAFTASCATAAARPIHLYLYKHDGTQVGSSSVISIYSNDTSASSTYTPNEDIVEGYLKCVSSRADTVTYTIKGYFDTSLIADGGITQRMLAERSVDYSKLADNPHWSSYNVVNLDDYISEIWIDKSVLPSGTIKVEARGNGDNGLYVVGRDTRNNPTTSCNINMTGIVNGKPYTIKQVASGYDIPVGTIVGYVVFKDIDGFITHDDNVQLKSFLNIPFVYDISYEPTINGYVNAIKEIESRINNRLDAVLPDTIYAVENTELNLWNDTIAYSIDDGLNSPRNYNVAWKTKVGSGIERCFRFTPTSTHVNKTYNGNVCYVYNSLGELVSSKEFAVKVVGKGAISSAKTITFFGDSYGASIMENLWGVFNDSDKFAGTIPTTVGTQGTTYKYNAQGGYTLSDYATAGRRAFRLQVTNAPAIVLNGKYTNNGKTWTVVEINVDSSGTGNILITKGDTSGSDAPQTSGTLVPATETVGENVPYTNSELTGANPLWDTDNNQLSLSVYKTRCGMQESDVIDAVIIALGTNNSDLGDNLENLDTYLTALYDLFVTNGNSSCKFILCLPAKYTDAFFGIASSYAGATDTTVDMKRIYDIKKKYLEFASANANVVISTVSNAIDRFYGYPLSLHNISARFLGVEDGGQTIIPRTEVYHTGYGHPNSSGYGQIADAVFSALMSCLGD